MNECIQKEKREHLFMKYGTNSKISARGNALQLCLPGFNRKQLFFSVMKMKKMYFCRREKLKNNQLLYNHV